MAGVPWQYSRAYQEGRADELVNVLHSDSHTLAQPPDA